MTVTDGAEAEISVTSDGRRLSETVRAEMLRRDRRNGRGGQLGFMLPARGPQAAPLPEAVPEMPAEWAGEIGIEWPAARPGAPAMSGWGVTPYDADGPVTTVQSITLHAAADSLVWAELTMFADEDGKPVLHGDWERAGGTPVPVPWLTEDGETRSGTFPFLITSMKMQGG